MKKLALMMVITACGLGCTLAEEAKVTYESISFIKGAPAIVRLLVMIPASWKVFPEQVFLPKGGEHLISVGIAGKYLGESKGFNEYRMSIEIAEHEGHGVLREDVPWEFLEGVSGKAVYKENDLIRLIRIDGGVLGVSIGKLDPDKIDKYIE